MKKSPINRKTTNKRKGSSAKKGTARESEKQSGKDQGVRAKDGKRNLKKKK